MKAKLSMPRSAAYTLVLVTALSTAMGTSALAAWSGEPTGLSSTSDSSATCTWTSTLNPNPALQMSTCDWIINGLSSQGFNEANGWTITKSAALSGSITIDKYYSWVTTQPTETLGGQTYGGTGPIECWGGAALKLNYTPGANDPTGTNVHWIQAIFTDDPTDWGRTNGYQIDSTGIYEYIDNARAGTMDPFYDHGYTATANGFLDIPARSCCGECGAVCPEVCNHSSRFWQAQAFLATGDLEAKTLTIYEDGVWWGFDISCVPEPNTLSLLLTALFVVVCRRKPRACQ